MRRAIKGNLPLDRLGALSRVEGLRSRLSEILDVCPIYASGLLKTAAIHLTHSHAPFKSY